MITRTYIKIREALLDTETDPARHRRNMRRLKFVWPELWHAVVLTLDERERQEMEERTR